MHDVASLILSLLIVLAAAKLLGAAAQRIGQPAVLGELLAGVLLGGSLLNVLHPTEPVMHALSELGVLVLLLEIGLHTDLRSLIRVGGTAAMVASVGVAVPFAAGYLVARVLGVTQLPVIVSARRSPRHRSGSRRACWPTSANSNRAKGRSCSARRCSTTSWD